MAELIVISALNGILYGLLLFLMASGLTLIFSMMGVLNFAHASFYMLGAFLGFQISLWIGYWPALILAPLIVGAGGALVKGPRAVSGQTQLQGSTAMPTVVARLCQLTRAADRFGECLRLTPRRSPRIGPLRPPLQRHGGECPRINTRL